MPAARTEGADDDLTPDERARLRELLNAKPSKPEAAAPRRRADDPKPSGQDERVAATLGISLRELEAISREQTLAVLAQLRTEEENEQRDEKIKQLEAALAASQKQERAPNVLTKLFRALWGTPPEQDDVAEAQAAAGRS